MSPKAVTIELPPPGATTHDVFAHRLGRRFIAVGLAALGLSLTDIGGLLGTDSKRIRAWKETFDRNGNLDDEQRSGRPHSLDEQAVEVVKDALRRAPPERAAYLGKIVAELQLAGAIRQDVTVETVRNALWADGLRYRSVVRLSCLDAKRSSRRLLQATGAHNRRERNLDDALAGGRDQRLVVPDECERRVSNGLV